ncbi:MAG: signal peptidase I [Anaerolineae bacterium]|nr:signal peptidase I [Anaerolineae bacterium]
MVVLWVQFSPTQFSGTASYVILSGNSMSPKFMLGDLVIVKEASIYKVGDAIAYKHPTINYIFHRIISINPDSTFQLQGDHNDWVDSYTPT